MPGKQARVLCPVCQEPIPPDETECGNCGAFVIDEAVVRLSRAFGLDRERALKLFEAGFRHPTQLRDRDPNRVLEKGEVGLLFICTNCGGFVAAADSKCPRCAAEFEAEPEAPAAEEEEDILDLVLCPACGADNDFDVVECEICGEALREAPKPGPVAAASVPVAAPIPKSTDREKTLEKVDDFLKEPEPVWPEPARPIREQPVAVVPRPVPKTPPLPAVPREVPQETPRPASQVRPPPRVSKPVSIPIRPGSTAAPTVPSPESRPSRIPTSAPKGTANTPSRPPVIPGSAMEPAMIPEPERPVSKVATRKTVLDASSNRIPRKRVRAPRPTSALSPETVAGLGLAGAAGLLLAGIMGQSLVSAGIAIFLAGLGAYLSIHLLRGAIPRPSRSDGILLVVGISLGLGTAALHGGTTTVGATALALGASFCFAWLTRRLLRAPQRILIAIGSAIPLIGHGLTASVDPNYPTTLPWVIGILASIPWPAALASTEILRRKSATVLRRQIVRAERDVARKDYERSLTEYDRAIATASKDVPGAEIPWYGKGATLILLGRYEEALLAIDRALDINPRNEVAWVNKGNALTRMGQLLDALRCFNAAIKVNPLYEVAWNNKGNTLARLGKHDEALRCYERALGIDPGYRGAWVNMGFVLTKLGRFDEAASCADRALRLEGGRRPEPA